MLEGVASYQQRLRLRRARMRSRASEGGAAMIRVGTSGWSYPSGQGHLERHLLSGAATRRARRGKFDELRFYAEHFDTVEINSTFYGVPAPATTQGLGRAHAQGLRVLAEALSEVHAPGDVPEGDGQRSAATSAERTSTSSARAIDPLASAGKLGALLAQFPASFKNEPDARGYLEWLLRAVQRVPRRRRTAASELERRPASNARAARRRSAPPGRRSTSRSSGTRSARTCCPTCRSFYYLRLHGRNAAQWWKHEKSEDRYNYLYSADELEPFAEAAGEAASAR